jgi:hypothetical protein
VKTTALGPTVAAIGFDTERAETPFRIDKFGPARFAHAKTLQIVLRQDGLMREKAEWRRGQDHPPRQFAKRRHRLRRDNRAPIRSRRTMAGRYRHAATRRPN